jgi:hypothetical protein
MRPFALALLASASLAGAALAGGPPATPTVSGLAWLSGSTEGDGSDCLGPFRNRSLDLGVNYVGHSSFAAMVSQTKPGGVFADTARKAPFWVVTLPLLTDDTKGQFAQCAAGAFDASWQQIGANLTASGAQAIVVRLGPEANGGSGHAWVVKTGQAQDYVACWRHAAGQLKSTAPGISLEWTSAKKTPNTALHVLPLSPGDPAGLYPGDDVVDLWGVHYYDSGPLMSTQKRWDAAYTRTFNGGPWGLGTWLQAARQHGKKLAVSEWGVWQQAGQAAAAADDPVYVDNVFRFFGANAADVAYESYFNKLSVHQLCPSTLFPNAAAKYQADWGLGATAARSAPR